MRILFATIWLFASLQACRRAEIVPTINLDCRELDSFPNSSSKAALYDKIVRDYVKKGLPGISVLISDSSGIWVGSAGYADIEKHVPFTTCHISKAASITKLLVGTLTMKLQELGRLSIDDPLSKYLDADILKKIENAEGKTIRQCLNHTTGIYDVITDSDFYLAVLNNPNRRWSAEDLLKYVYGRKGYTLGQPYPALYSNTNTLLVSMCIEKATGRSHAELLRELILKPNGMMNTYYQGHDETPSNVAQGYYDLHNNGTLCNVSNLITGSGNGYGGMFSNVYDLYRFHKALLIDKTILSQASLNTMQEFVHEDEDFYTGVGMIKKFTKKAAFGIGHTGRDLGYNANLFYFPSKNAIMVFFVNYGTNGESRLKQTFFDFESDLADALLQ